MKKTMKTIMKNILFAAPLFFVFQNEANAATFNDVPTNHWAYSTIKEATTSGYVKGKGDGTFGVNDNVTRAEFATMLDRVIEKEVTGVKGNFTDVSENYWGKNAIEKGVALGFVVPTDYANNKFEPNKAITRLEMAKMIARALAINEDYKNLLNTFKDLYNGDMPFTDWKTMQQQDIPYIAMTTGAEIANGYPDGSYGLNQVTSRAEATVMLQRFVNTYEQPTSNFQYLNELKEVAETGTNALAVSSLVPKRDNYEGIKLEHNNFQFKTKRLYVIPLQDVKNKISFFEKKFVVDRQKLFEKNANYSDSSKINGIIVTIADMTFKQTDTFYNIFGTVLFSANGRHSFVYDEPMKKYGLLYQPMGSYSNTPVIKGEKGKTNEIVMYGHWGQNDIGLSIHISNNNHQQLFTNPLNKFVSK